MYSYLQKKKENPNTKQENRFSLSVGASDIAKKFLSFLNSLISLNITKGDHDRDIVWYLISISIDFYDFFFFVSTLLLVSIEKIYQTLQKVFGHINTSKLVKNTPVHVAF